MKIATVILSLYVLLLAVMPCPCGRTYSSVSAAEQGAVVSCACHTHGGMPDLCTPFCVVSQCMHTPVAIFKKALATTPPPVPARKSYAAAGQDKPVLMFRGTVWHPPIAGV